MEILKITSQNFNDEVINSDVPVFIDFWASWCMPCKMMAPVLDEIANELGDNIKIGKVNVDEETALATEYGVMSIPTFIVFRNGEAYARTVGVQEKKKIIDILS